MCIRDSRNTAFLWRHKILDALQNMADDVTLDGIIEADETFFAISYKGNHSKSCLLYTSDQAHLMDSAQQNGCVNGKAPSAGVDGGKGGTITKPLRGEAQISQGRRGGAVPDLPAAKESSSRVLGKKTGSKSIRPVKADGNRPKTGTVLQKRKTMAKGGKVAQKQVSPAQRAKALTQKKARQKAQKAMARKAAQQTKVAAAKAGKLAMRFAMAVGRAAAAAVQGILAAGGGIVLLIVMLCLIPVSYTHLDVYKRQV